MKIGFVGCGNMATAIIGGILEKGILKKEDIKASTKTENSAKKVQETLGIECTTDNKKAVQDADVIFLAVKPQFCEEVIQEIKSEIKSEQVIISIAAGKKLEWLEAQFGAEQVIKLSVPCQIHRRWLEKVLPVSARIKRLQKENLKMRWCCFVLLDVQTP